MRNAEFWDNFKKLDDRFGAEEVKLCKKHGFATSLEGWNYCPYCGEEMCE